MHPSRCRQVSSSQQLAPPLFFSLHLHPHENMFEFGITIDVKSRKRPSFLCTVTHAALIGLPSARSHPLDLPSSPYLPSKHIVFFPSLSTPLQHRSYRSPMIHSLYGPSAGSVYIGTPADKPTRRTVNAGSVYVRTLAKVSTLSCISGAWGSNLISTLSGYVLLRYMLTHLS
jgi:hypothetical protein